ncbi:MAG: porphobilinogen synthase [Nitrososphaerota archaeon]|nr:porphobilinogen synthase [Nitrososphaerota archaeon]
METQAERVEKIGAAFKLRPRRLRTSQNIRELVSETWVNASQLVMPIFVKEGAGIKETIDSMPGIFRYSPDTSLDSEVEEISSLGLKSVLLFGLPKFKDQLGSGAYDKSGVVQVATRRIKQAHPELTVITDVCMCEYTNHGHCGIVAPNGTVQNQETIEYLSKIAVSQAEAGADIVAPSAMMDQQVSSIRRGLDSNGFEDIPIMSYSSKYASAFYGPFREAADSAPSFGDRRSYQMNPANSREALREMQLDFEEGADILMVKPALSYLDVIMMAKQEFNMPLAAYSVSGEYSMIKAAAINGWLDEARTIDETLLAIRRAGADILITYFAKQYVRNAATLGSKLNNRE